MVIKVLQAKIKTIDDKNHIKIWTEKDITLDASLFEAKAEKKPEKKPQPEEKKEPKK